MYDEKNMWLTTVISETKNLHETKKQLEKITQNSLRKVMIKEKVSFLIL